jgi:chromosome partitioning protein
MKTLAVSSLKGGAGKSTTAAALAVEAARRGERVALLNLDPQDTLEQWWERRGEPENPAIVKVQGSLARCLDGLEEEGCTLAILDTPPAIVRTITAAIGAADLVVIPVRPSMLDLESTETMMEIIEGEGSPFIFVVSAAPPQGHAGDQLATTLQVFGSVARSHITHRAAHVRAMSKGATGGELDDTAQKEIAALWKEVAALLPKERV